MTSPSPRQRPPIAVNDSTNTLEDVSVTIKVLANDYNPDGTPLTITNTFTTNGTAVISGTNIVFHAVHQLQRHGSLQLYHHRWHELRLR